MDSVPLLGAMTILIGFSAFFSASEAALFSLRAADRNALRGSSRRSSRLAAQLLEDPDRLLTAVLFWNLLVNIVYFALASLTGFKLDVSGVGKSTLLVFTVGILLAIIFLSEMMPKSFAVMKARRLSTFVSIPLSLAVRAVDPLMPALRVINLLSRRLIWPSFKEESYLDVNDLARAIELSTDRVELNVHERGLLRNVVSLSDLRADECMRPRSQLMTFRPPVIWDRLRLKLPPSGYLLVTESDSDEIVSAVELRSLSEIKSDHLEYHAKAVLYVPWCATVADILQRLESRERDVAVVVNELGDTIGVLTRKDILDVVFTDRTSRSERLLKREPIHPIGESLWQVTGMTNLRVLEEFFEIDLPETQAITVAGVMQENLQRLPEVGDECEWGSFHFEVVELPPDDQIVVNLSRVDQMEDDS